MKKKEFMAKFVVFIFGIFLSGNVASSENDVGIIPGNSGCPCNTERIVIYMDDEDDDKVNDNSNENTGWIGAIEQDHDTKFVFCRVDGNKFGNMSWEGFPYAVLKLGRTCPEGSLEFSRYFDNENDNENYTEGDIYPNTSGDSYTDLSFCFFPVSIESNMGSFPYFRRISGTDHTIEYGVFAPSFAQDLSPSIEIGMLKIDDEDDDNNDFFRLNNIPNSYIEGIYGIISSWDPENIDKENTIIRLAKVRDETFRWIDHFGALPVAGDWDNNNKWPRMMADVDKDGAADIVAFGSSGVWVSIADPDNPIINKRFKERQRWTEWFGSDANVGGWDDNNKWPRMMADVDKDGAADIVAFGSSGVWVSIADPDNPII
ncbi:MAG: hypothetical protein GY795_46940, partial [Desulfobacterales bacterium]|nr:hypothetical protein [Desulfobacterales bacterium]